MVNIVLKIKIKSYGLSSGAILNENGSGPIFKVTVFFDIENIING